MIDLGQRQSESNVRYAEIDGQQELITENNDKYIIPLGTDNLLVEVTEKTADGEFVKSQYFYIDMNEKTYTKLSMDSYMTTDGKKSIRTSSPMGIRFRYGALTSAKAEQEEYVIDEIGFLVAVTDVLGEEELTLDFSKYVTGVAYNKINGVFAATNFDLLNCILRGEWGFDGMVMTDWNNAAVPKDHPICGNDLIMPGCHRSKILDGLKDGSLPKADAQACAVRILRTILRSNFTIRERK